MLFDQYSRYNALKQLLNKSNFDDNKTLLDIGSGPECLLGSIIKSENITYLDPLITKQNDEQYINGNIFIKRLDGKKFNYTTAIDVLEHIPLAIRDGFLEKLSELSDEYIIIAFPSSENQDAIDVDNHVNEEYRVVYEKDYSWLEEHFEYGLPSLKETINKLESLGWNCTSIGHGYTPWLKMMLGYTIASWDRVEYKDMILAMSQKFNDELVKYDFNEPYYRDFVIASKKQLPNIAELKVQMSDDAKIRFFEILEESRKDFQIISTKNILKLEDDFSNKHEELMSMSDWASELKDNIAEKDINIIKLNKEKEQLEKELQAKKIINIKQNKEIDLLNQSIELYKNDINDKDIKLNSKQEELMQMSDWASGMSNRLQQIDNNRLLRNIIKLVSYDISLFQLTKKVIKKITKKILPQSIIDKYRFNKIKINFDEVKKNIDVNKKVIIAFPIITWGFRFQRPQHLLKELSKKGYTVIYLAMDMQPKGIIFNSIEDAGSNVSFTKLDENIYKIWLHSYESINIYTDHISDENLTNLSLSIQSALKVLKPKEIIYMVQFPGWNKLVFDVNSNYNGKVVFDCMDDHSGFSTNDKSSLKEEKKLLKKSDIVISSSQLLYDKNILENKNTIQVKNGTEFEYFNKSTKNGKLAYLNKKPIIGYYGAISDWFDMEIIEHCATVLPQYNFVMIGATFGCDISKAQKIGNVHFLGEIAYQELTGYFAYFDVCLIPFKIIPLTLATNPVKFYEYLSAGKPVVSVKLPELIAYEKYCYLAENKEDFCSKIELALNEKSEELIRNRIELAKDNSWAKRAEKIYSKIKEG